MSGVSKAGIHQPVRVLGCFLAWLAGLMRRVNQKLLETLRSKRMWVYRKTNLVGDESPIADGPFPKAEAPNCR